MTRDEKNMVHLDDDCIISTVSVHPCDEVIDFEFEKNVHGKHELFAAFGFSLGIEDAAMLRDQLEAAIGEYHQIYTKGSDV